MGEINVTFDKESVWEKKEEQEWCLHEHRAGRELLAQPGPQRLERMQRQSPQLLESKTFFSSSK